MNNYNFQGYGQANERRFQAPKNCSMPRNALPPEVAVAMAYVPFQECNDVYPCEKALFMGTVFPVLSKPFLAGCCK